jgi:hypothetical protein
MCDSSGDNAGKNMTMKYDPEFKPFDVDLKFLVLELLKEMKRLKENSKHFMG